MVTIAIYSKDQMDIRKVSEETKRLIHIDESLPIGYSFSQITQPFFGQSYQGDIEKDIDFEEDLWDKFPLPEDIDHHSKYLIYNGM